MLDCPHSQKVVFNLQSKVPITYFPFYVWRVAMVADYNFSWGGEKSQSHLAKYTCELTKHLYLEIMFGRPF